MKAFITALTIIMTACFSAGCATKLDVSTTGGDEDGVKSIVVNNRMQNASDTNPGVT